MKKIKGESAFIASLISLGVLCLFFAFFLSTFVHIDKKQELENCLRKYVLAMEADGFLKNSNQILLEKELEDSGMTSGTISFEGSSLSKVQYGEFIILKVQGNIEVPVLSSIGSEGKIINETQTIYFKLKSTFLGY